MYSVVLMMALSGGGEAVDFGHRKACHGGGAPVCSGYAAPACSGYVAPVSSGYVGCTGVSGSACTGRAHGHRACTGGGLFSKLRKHGCHGGAVACSGGGYSGTCYGGSSYGGCVGSSPYGGCVGGMGGGIYVAPKGETPKVMPKEIKEIKEIKKTSITAPATIVVSLPAAATLTVDGNPTTSTSAQRTLVTPSLETDSTYIYTLQVQVNGQTQTQQIRVRGGQTAQAQFSFPQTVASR
jgi:uncharacterized protein (TIGR03000 family)